MIGGGDTMNNRDLKAKLMTGVADAMIWMQENKMETLLLFLASVGVVALLALIIR